MAGPIHWLATVLSAPFRAARFIVRGDSRLADVGEVARSGRKTTNQVAGDVRRIDERLQKQSVRLDKLQEDLHLTRREISGGLLRVNLQLSAMMRVVQQMRASTHDHDGAEKRLSGRTIPLTVGSEEPQWSPVIGGEIHPDPEGKEWLLLDKCPFCGHPERTLVVEWNKLIMLAKAPDQQSARYDYSCCHRCGVVYAARRPIGERFRFLLQHFGEVTGKAAADGVIPNPLLNPYPSTEGDRERLRRMAQRGVWVSEHLGLGKSDYIEGALKDRFENSVHVDLLGNLVNPTGARVLEIRPRAGTIAESLRRLYNAQVFVIPMWESQKFVLKELYGFDADGLIDYDRFHIPFDGRFDLIVCNHILVHSLRAGDLLAELHAHLNPGGSIYFYNEPDDRQILGEDKSIIAHLNPLHMHTFDHRSMIRALAANGLEVTFIRSRNASFMVLARSVSGNVAWTPIAPEELTQRIGAYRLARDRAILKVPTEMRSRLGGGDWADAVEHGLESGVLEFDEKGQLRFAVH
jgi:SAM-dependent methyltransferase